MSNDTAKYVRWLEVRSYVGNELVDIHLYDAYGRVEAIMMQEAERQLGRKAIIVKCETTDLVV